MLQQARMPRGSAGMGQVRQDCEEMRNERTIRLDINRLVMARYFVVFFGAVLLLSLPAQAFLLGEGVSFSRVLIVTLVAVMGPGLVWASSDKEVRLLRQLGTRDQQLEQRTRENMALNRMTQAHLADCLNSSQEPDSPFDLPPLVRDHAHGGNEPSWSPLRPDFKNVVVLDPADQNFDRRYFEAASSGHRN